MDAVVDIPLEQDIYGLIWKNQAKKVVCIPAPAPANSRPSTGEIVPSDLWAWRKYGQKPIKGSPYPRGYYRCSSSKGCLARKQVERSRTDPNMLVITYTAEHNHPWPTQRNALAGSTRSHHSTKNTTKNNPLINISNAPNAPNPPVTNESELDPNLVAIKEELENDHFEMDDPDFDEGYNPALHDGSEQPVDNFFTDFGEIDANPTSLMFGLEYWGGNSGGATTSERSGTAGFYGEAKRDS